MKKLFCAAGAALPLLLLSGCGIGSKAASLSTVYAAAAIFSFVLLAGYCFLSGKKDAWFLLLFSSVFIVNSGYYCLSVSQTLSEALLANRISYLGSVFLPMSMALIIMNCCGISCKRHFMGILLGVSILTFLVAASPGYSDIYYKEVTLVTQNGISVLDKVYGSWHCVYLYYLLLYFCGMIGIIFYATFKKKLESTAQAIFLMLAVFVNICVWLLEQLVQLDFEFLSVSYIISELFLLSLHLILPKAQTQFSSGEIAQKESLPEPPSASPISTESVSCVEAEQRQYLENNLWRLTPTERTIFDLYLTGKTSKQIMDELSIKENTLKYHNRNMYSKLGISSRKQMMEIACSRNTPGRE